MSASLASFSPVFPFLPVSRVPSYWEVMTVRQGVAVALVALVLVGSHLKPTQAPCSTQDGQPIPCIELEPALKQIFVIDHCEAISGLTCRIQYNGKKPLPSEIFFYDIDSSGRQLCKPTRLTYPRLSPGQTGRATFLDRCDADPDHILLKGKWSGPYKSPY